MNPAMNYGMTENKSQPAATQTVKKYGQQLLHFIKGKVKSLEDAEDVLQEVWYQFSNLSSLEDLENVSGWLYYVAKNKIIDLYRKKKNFSLEDMSIEEEDGGFSIKEVLLMDDSNDTQRTFFKDMFWKELRKALDELPENQRQVFILNEMEEMTLQEIADKQGQNLKTIISRKGYAVKHLRERLEPLYQELYQ